MPSQIYAHHVVVVVGAPEIGAAARAEVSLVAFGFVDPLPVEVTPEVDVQRAQAAALFGVPTSIRGCFENNLSLFYDIDFEGDIGGGGGGGGGGVVSVMGKFKWVDAGLWSNCRS